jgi:hypothetical protein
MSEIVSWIGRILKKRHKPVDGVMCGCTKKEIPIETVVFVSRAPLEGGGWTQFYVHRCKLCKGLRGFPHENMLIAMHQGTEETRRGLRKYGVRC